LGGTAGGLGPTPDLPEGCAAVMRRRQRKLATASTWAARRMLLAFVLAVPGVLAHPSVSMPASPDRVPSTEMIDPDCDPQAARNADPSTVKEPDEVCPPDATEPRQEGPQRRPRKSKEPSSDKPTRTAEGGKKSERAASRSKSRERRKSRRRRAGTNTNRKARDPRERRRARRHRALLPIPDGPPAYPKPDSVGTIPDPPSTARLPDMRIPRSRVPAFLVPIFRAAGSRYRISWEILAAINEIETGYGSNLNVSYAGAVGWMQFMPATWRMYGMDANKDGRKDPYDPVDAIFAAARYLKAAGYDRDVRRAIFAYNHAHWYVDSVILRARLIAALPARVLSPRPRGRRLDSARARRLAELSLSALAWELALAVLQPIRSDEAAVEHRARLRVLAGRLLALSTPRDRSHGVVRLLTRVRPLRPLVVAQTALEGILEPT
jgi:hypothetical protein